MKDLPWNEALAYTMLVALLLGALVAAGIHAFKRWHNANYIPRARVNDANVTVCIPFSQRDFKP
jgi:hypothetical protein